MKICDIDEQFLSFSYSQRFAQNDQKTFNSTAHAAPYLYDYSKMTLIQPVITHNDMSKLDYLLLMHPVKGVHIVPANEKNR